jgi:hypothetical protein
MPRARNLKPGFFSNEDLAECSPWARLCFAGLWTLADREGRLEDRPKRIKGELFRFDAIEVEPLLQELARFKFIVRYEIDGDRFIEIPEFKAHQTPHYSEKQSVIKPPPPQEKQWNIEPTNSESTPRKEGSSRGGHNPLNPESRILIPDSPNPSPPEKKARKRATPPEVARPANVSEQVWTDWLALRAKKRAPVTSTVVANAIGEAGRAGMTLDAFLSVWCARGSQGLQADWLKPQERASHQPAAETTWQRTQRERVAEMTGGMVSRKPPAQGEIVEVDDARPVAARLG